MDVIVDRSGSIAPIQRHLWHVGFTADSGCIVAMQCDSTPGGGVGTQIMI